MQDLNCGLKVNFFKLKDRIGGLNSDVSLILITNGIFPIIMSILDPMYFFRLI